MSAKQLLLLAALCACSSAKPAAASHSFAQFGGDSSTAAPDDSVFEVPAHILTTCTPGTLPTLGFASFPW